MIPKNDEIIVYVISRIRNYRNWDYILDFRLKEDYGHYIEAIGIREESSESHGVEGDEAILSITPSLILLKNVPSKESGQSFREGSYYCLNIDSLLNARFVTPQRDGLIIGIYNFEGINTKDEDLPLIPKKKPLDSADLKKIPNQGGTDFLPSIIPHKITIVVRDVGQGNWNEVLFNDEYRIIYDIGTSIHAGYKTMREYMLDRYDEYKNFKPILVLSHWDADHINCLSVFNNKELEECFSAVFCMNQMNSMLSNQIYANLMQVFKKNLFCFDPCEKEIPDSQRRVVLNNLSSFYIGRKNRNINFSGMSVFVKGKEGSANLTGDIKLIQANDIFKEERKRNLGIANHLLVAPHHGGRYSSGRKEYINPISKVAISVGSGNIYGHPEERMFQLYENISYQKVHRTDLHQECVFDFK